MMQVDSGNLKNTPTKKSLEVLGEDKGTIKRDKNTLREEREMDRGWTTVLTLFLLGFVEKYT